MQKYQNKPVTTLRSAKQGDVGFDAAKDQIIIKLDDNTEKLVLRSDVTNS